MRRRLALTAFLIGVAVVASDPEGPGGHLAYYACYLSLVAAAWWAVRRPTTRSRLPWVLIACTQTCWVGADALFTVLSARQPDLQVSVCDAFWLGGYPLLAASMLLMVRHRAPGQARDGILDGLTVASAAAMGVWLLVVAPTVGDRFGTAELIQLLYPVGDVVVLLATCFLALTPGRRGVATRLLLAGAAVTFVGDTAISLLADTVSLTMQARFDAVFLLGNAAIVAATCTRHRDEELLAPPVAGDEPVHPTRVLFLGCALLAGPMLFIARGTLTAPERIALGLGSTVTVAFALARFSLAILEQDRTRRELIHLAAHDALTGLANRRRLAEQLGSRFAPIAELVLFYIDLDGFKGVNDAHGHAAGDAVLVEIARRLQGQVREGDLVARLGGDEFAVLCCDLPTDRVPSMTTRLTQVFHEPVVHQGVAMRISGSVGIGCAAGCADSEQLIRTADAAMFRAKRAVPTRA